ncbi:MAG: endolytic transglycosylase MltG, partial [Caldilineaceae bacterium]
MTLIPPVIRRRFRMLFLVLVTLILAGCGGASRYMLSAYLEDHEASLTVPAGTDTTMVPFTVEPGTPAEVIGENLMAAGLIDDDLLFEAYVRVNGLATQLEAGTFSLAPSMTLIEIVETLQNALAR